MGAILNRRLKVRRERRAKVCGAVSRDSLDAIWTLVSVLRKRVEEIGDNQFIHHVRLRDQEEIITDLIHAVFDEGREEVTFQ